MKLKFNKKFKDLVGKGFSIETIEPCQTFLFIKCEDIISIDGLYYFERFKPKFQRLPPLDPMCYEYDTNKIRVDELVNTRINSSESFWCGLCILKELISRLQNLYGKGFEVILSFNYEHTFIRFYKIRDGINIVMSDDLEGFKSEAILKVSI